MEEKFIIVWTVDGETMNLPHSTQAEALHQAEKLLREHGCDLEGTLHLDEISPPSFQLVINSGRPTPVLRALALASAIARATGGIHDRRYRQHLVLGYTDPDKIEYYRTPHRRHTRIHTAQTAQNPIQARNRVRGDRNAAAKARQLWASCPSTGNLAVRKSAWWT